MADKDLKVPLRVVIAGHVDHGKSTLIGRLLYDTDSLPEGKAAEIEEICRGRGTDDIEWSFLLDSFQAERDQAITIDTTQIWFATALRDYVIIDAPGHREFLKNMISGAAAADAAILVVDAVEGVREQTRRHAYLLHLLGLKQIAVVINKMDKVNYDADRFEIVRQEIEAYLETLGLAALHIVPLSARQGDMIAARGDHMGWYQGAVLTGVLDGFQPRLQPVARPLRFPVQDVYRRGEQRIITGRVESGILRKGDTLFFSPVNEKAVVSDLVVWPDDPDKIEARAGEVVGVTLDEKIFVERGHIGSHETSPPMLSNVLRAHIFWFDERPLLVGNSYKMRYGTHEAMVSVQTIDRVIDTQDLAQDEQARTVPRGAVAEVTLRARELLPLDPCAENESLGRFVLYDGYDVAGGGTINMDGYPDQRENAPKAQNIFMVDHLMTYEERARRNGHYGGVFWFTGLSGAGKSSLAMAVEKELFRRGRLTYVLDGDNVRHGLCADLGFSPQDRAENIRRVGQVAALQADAGLITLTAFISPYRADREKARLAAPERFHEIYVKADLETCERRDPKGLYKKARSGEIREFTGIDAPYEAPDNPDLIVDTQNHDLGVCVRQVADYIERHMSLPARQTGREREENDKIAVLS